MEEKLTYCYAVEIKTKNLTRKDVDKIEHYAKTCKNIGVGTPDDEKGAKFAVLFKNKESQDYFFMKCYVANYDCKKIKLKMDLCNGTAEKVNKKMQVTKNLA